MSRNATGSTVGWTLKSRHAHMSPVDRDQLSIRFDGLLARLRLGGGAEAFNRLFESYTASDRHYHDIRHITASLAELDGVRSHCEHCDAVELAIWFHDCVYDADRLDNEEKSADIAREALSKLGASGELIDRVCGLILATRHVGPPATQDERVIVDIDLSPLGAAPSVFDANGESIRREYRHLDDAAYGVGRGEILQRFLDRSRIYATDTFASRYERQARANLARSIGGNGKSRA